MFDNIDNYRSMRIWFGARVVDIVLELVVFVVIEVLEYNIGFW